MYEKLPIRGCPWTLKFPFWNHPSAVWIRSASWRMNMIYTFLFKHWNYFDLLFNYFKVQEILNSIEYSQTFFSWNWQTNFIGFWCWIWRLFKPYKCNIMALDTNRSSFFICHHRTRAGFLTSIFCYLPL